MEKQDKHAYIWAVQGKPPKIAFGFIFQGHGFCLKSSHVHTSTRSQPSSNANHWNVKPRNVKCEPQPCGLLQRDLSSLNLLENGTTNWIIFTQHNILEYCFSAPGNNYNCDKHNTDFKSHVQPPRSLLFLQRVIADLEGLPLATTGRSELLPVKLPMF